MSCGTQSDTRPPGRAPCLSLSLSLSLRDCHKRFPFLKFGERSSSIFCCLGTVTPFQREKVYNYHFLHIAATFRTAVMDLISCKYIVSRPLFWARHFMKAHSLICWYTALCKRNTCFCDKGQYFNASTNWLNVSILFFFSFPALVMLYSKAGRPVRIGLFDNLVCARIMKQSNVCLDLTRSLFIKSPRVVKRCLPVRVCGIFSHVVSFIWIWVNLWVKV